MAKITSQQFLDELNEAILDMSLDLKRAGDGIHPTSKIDVLETARAVNLMIEAAAGLNRKLLGLAALKFKEGKSTT